MRKYEIDLKHDVDELKGSGAYTLLHKATGKVYHGSSCDLNRRKNEHLASLARGEHSNSSLQNCVRADPSLELTIYPTAGMEDALDLEQWMIDNTPEESLLNISKNARSSMTGINEVLSVKEKLSKTRAGNKNALGTKHTEDFKQAASERMSGNRNLQGYKHSVDTRTKMSQAHTGKKPNAEAILKSAIGRTKRNIVIDNVEYLNAAAAAKVIGITDGGINKRCKSINFPNYSFKEV